MEKLIFLDFDGVLNSAANYRRLKELGKPTSDKWGTAFDEGCVEALRGIVEATGAEIVVTSSWRYYLDLNDIRQMWKARGLPGKVRGFTPMDLIVDPMSATMRGEEVQEWLRQHRADKTSNYLILDDENQYLPHQQPHLILTDPTTGLSAPNTQSAIDILNDQNNTK